MDPLRTRNSAFIKFPEIAQLFPNLCGDVVVGRQQEDGTAGLIDVCAASIGRKQSVGDDSQFVTMELHFLSLLVAEIKKNKFLC